jgi:hypothetical protein
MPVMSDLITRRLVLHRLTVLEAARIVGGIAGPGDVWADGFPGEGDRDAARMAVKAAKARVEAHALVHRHGGGYLGSDLAAAAGYGFWLADGSVFSCSCPDRGSEALDIGPFTCYRIDCRADNTAIGTIGFHGPPDARQQVTIGYGLVAHSWGNGYATEAVHALIDFCRAHPDVRSIAADTDHDNLASQRVLTKSGFSLVRRDRDLIYYELSLGK